MPDFFYGWVNRKRIFLLGPLLILAIFSIFYRLDSDNNIPVSSLTNHNWYLGVSRYNKNAFLIEKNPFSTGMRVGSHLKFGDEHDYLITEISPLAKPLWQIGEFRDITLSGSRIPLWEIRTDRPLSDLHTTREFSLDKIFKGDVFYIFSFLLLLLLSLLISLISFSIFNYYGIFKLVENNYKIIFGLSYFISISYLLLIWRLLSAVIQDARLAFLLTILFPIIFVWLRKDFRNAIIYNLREILYVSYILFYFSFFISVFILFVWITPEPSALDTNLLSSTVGLFESGRYGNISYFIYKLNIIPVLSQNYGQSILSVLLFWVGVDSPRLALILWLAISLAAICVMLLGFLEWLGWKRKAQIFISLLLLLGGPRLTLLMVTLTDNRSTPLISNAYADTIISLGALFSSFILVEFAIRNKLNDTSKLLWVIIFFLLSSVWVITGIQSVNIFMIFLFILILRCVFLRNGSPIFILILMAASASGILIALPFGGLLTPDAFLNKEHYIAGVLKSPPFTWDDIWLRLHSRYGWILNPLDWQLRREGWFAPYFYDMKWNSVSEIYQNILSMETVITDVMRSWFLTLLGIFMWTKLIFGKDSHYKNLYIFNIIAVSCGVLFSSLITLRGIFWELLRFANAGYFFGILMFAMGLYKFLARSGKKKLILVLPILILAGPIAGISMQIYGGFRLSFSEKINAIIFIPAQTLDTENRDRNRR